jgi:hypothetical protein
MEETESLSDIIQSPFVTGEKPASPAVETKEAVAEVRTEAKAETKVEAEAPETKAPTRDESGRFAKTEEKEDTDGRTVALRAERERRRALEARLKELESAKPAEKVSIFEDEEKGIAQRVAEHSRPLREANFNMSVKLARLTYKEEFEKAEAAFFDSAEADPRLYEQLRSSADPGEFIFTIGTQISELGPVGGNFMKYREKVTGELKTELGKRDEVIAALKAENERLKKGQAELESIPRSLNKGNEASPKSTAEADDDDLKSITRFGKTG